MSRGVCGLLIVAVLSGGNSGGIAQERERPPTAETPESKDPAAGYVRGDSRSVLDEAYLPAPLTPDRREVWDRMRRDTTSVEAFYDLGNAYYDEGSLERAGAALNEALERDPDHLASLVNLGVVLNEMGRADEAMGHLARAVERSPDDVLALCNLGLSYYAKGDHAKAVDLYTRALATEPDSQLAHYNLGVAFADAGIYQEAIREWELVIRANPDSDGARQAQDNIRVIRNLLRHSE